MGTRADATGEELVLVHLLDSPKGSEAERHPSLTQNGIADQTGLERSYVSVLLGKITESGLAVRSLDRVKGSRRKVGVFALTPHGFERALSIKQRLVSSAVTVKVDGQAREMELRDALKLFAGESAASLVSKSQRGVPDASAGEPISGEIARTQKLLDEGRQADCAALMRGFANRWIRAGYHDEFLIISSAIDKSRVPAGDFCGFASPASSFASSFVRSYGERVRTTRYTGDVTSPIPRTAWSISAAGMPVRSRTWLRRNSSVAMRIG